MNIGIAGPMGAGKTTVAERLEAEHGYVRMSLATPLRYLSTLLLGRAIDKKVDRAVLQRVGGAARSPAWRGIDTPYEPARRERVDALAHHLFPEAPPERIEALYRALYQEGYAYGWGDPNYWLTRWRRDFLRQTKPVVVDDLRFPIEGDWLGRCGFFLAFLEVPLAERQRRIIQRDGAWDPAWSLDATEALVDDIPIHCKVDGTGAPERVESAVLMQALEWSQRRFTASDRAGMLKAQAAGSRQGNNG
ncbi:MAG: hypothetical protein VKP62_07285 [Candidatus Sericytochromatia bacterium]|nr:hypothetical protein [Candidatus Sericytochromatia bacterium]